MALLPLHFSASFSAVFNSIRSERVRERIKRRILNLRMFPDMGSSNPRPSLLERYGDDIQALSVDGYVVVYRHRPEQVDVLALVPGSSVR